jgi:hypothetical protein
MTPKSLEVGDLQWRTAIRSAGNGACVQVAPVDGAILIRDSKDQDGPVVQYPDNSWRMFLGSAKRGRFDPERLQLQPLCMERGAARASCPDSDRIPGHWAALSHVSYES